MFFELRKWNRLSSPQGLKFKKPGCLHQDKNSYFSLVFFFWLVLFFHLLELELLLHTWSASSLTQWMIQSLLHYSQHCFHQYLFNPVILIYLNNIPVTINIKPKSIEQSRLERSWYRKIIGTSVTLVRLHRVKF